VWQKLAQSEHSKSEEIGFSWIFLDFPADFNTESVIPTSFCGFNCYGLTSHSIAAFVWLSFTLF